MARWVGDASEGRGGGGVEEADEVGWVSSPSSSGEPRDASRSSSASRDSSTSTCRTAARRATWRVVRRAVASTAIEEAILSFSLDALVVRRCDGPSRFLTGTGTGKFSGNEMSPVKKIFDTFVINPRSATKLYSALSTFPPKTGVG